MIRLEQILEAVQRCHPDDDLEVVRRAYIFSAKEHKGQVRASGEPYMTHPLEVANVLAELKMDAVTVSVGLLHDVVEDTLTTVDHLEEIFGTEIAHIVDALTKISQIYFTSTEHKQAENFRKMLLAMSDDVRVIIVKLADRLHNMRTLKHLKAARREAIARETLEIYAPLAHRLGMGKVRGELEDLAFSFLDPKAYDHLKVALEAKRKVNDEFLAEVRATVELKMAEHDIPCRTEARIKRIYSIHHKLRRQRIGLDQVYDLLAVRIVTDDIKNCYAALGVIHNTWRPVPGRIKDFIAMPRPNMYQSLHSSVIARGQPFEIQIRTEEMHSVAEEGIAAHWKYKDGKLVADDREDQRVSWLRHLVEWQQEMKDPTDFLSTLKADLYSEEVYTFSPQGKVVTLPRDATPVDFAYTIHTEVGNTCVGAKINGRLLPLRSKLSNGDIVEIVTQAGQRPSRDWLNFVRTSRARNKIRQWLTLQERTKSIELGRKLLEKEARKHKVNLKSLIEGDRLLEVASEYGCARVDDILSGIGYGKISVKGLLETIDPEFAKAPSNQESKLTSVVKRVLGLGEDVTVKVRGMDDVLVYRAKCCNPIRGEEIIGYVTRGKGVAVHSKDCSNVQNLMYEADRRINVEWAGKSKAKETYSVILAIVTEDRPGMLAAISSAVSGVQANILDMSARTDEERGIIDMTVQIPDMKRLEKVISSVRQLGGVYDVMRSTTLSQEAVNETTKVGRE
jgi:guanosine-3',5'-bis(diphosphate) 3'-pyrophosphohydrolase